MTATDTFVVGVAVVGFCCLSVLLGLALGLAVNALIDWRERRKATALTDTDQA